MHGEGTYIIHKAGHCDYLTESAKWGQFSENPRTLLRTVYPKFLKEEEKIIKSVQTYKVCVATT